MARARLESLTLQCTTTNRVCLSVPTVWSDIHIPRLKWVFNAYDELLQLWCYAEDLDSFEHAGSEVVTFMTGEVSCLFHYGERSLIWPQTDNTDLQDDVSGHWIVEASLD